MITANIETISPQLAAQLLTTSIGNRRLRNKLITKYSDDMVTGSWELNGEAIQIDEDGHLKNGHHRLNAVIKSGKSINFLVVRGIPRESRTFDKGAGRTTSDNLKFAGYEPYIYSNNSVALANFCIINVEKRSIVSTDSIVLDYIDNNKEHFKFAYSILNNSKGGKIRLQRKTPILAAIFYAHKCGVKEEKINRFVDILNSGFYDSNSELSAVVLRNQMIDFGGLKSESERLLMFKITQDAINSFDIGYARKLKFKGSEIYSSKFKNKEKCVSV